MSNKTLRLIQVTGDNEGLFTQRAYEELRLQMSTGDFHTHTAKQIECTDAVKYFDFDSETNEFYIVVE